MQSQTAIKHFSIKNILLGAFFFFALFPVHAKGRADGSRWNTPALDVTTIDQRTRLIRFDWSKVDYPDDYRYGLYRLDRSTRTNVFLKEIVKTDAQFADTGLKPPLYNYFYVIENVPKDEMLQERKDIRAPSDREIAQQTISAYYIDTRNPQYWIDEDTPSAAERAMEDNTPRPPPGRRTAQTQSPNEGIYIGLISFSGKIREITKDPVLIPLDPAGRQELMDKLNVAYTQSHDFGSAPYYAIHRALANLSELQRNGGLPRNIDRVSMITFTDGLDTSSTDSSFTPLEGKDFRPGSGNRPEDYKDFIVNELKHRTIGGVRIDAYTIGVEGNNKKNNWTFSQLLREMSTDDMHYASLGDIGQLQGNLSTLADVLNIYTSIVNFTFTTPAYPVGTTVRFTFDKGIKDPNKAKYWVEGDVDWVNGKYVLTNLCSNGIHLGSTENVLGLRTERGIEYTIRLNDDFYVENLQQWQLPPDVQNLTANWVLIHDFKTEKSLDVVRGRKSSIIYLVLDCNPALKAEEINSIRGAVQLFIDKLYASAGSGIKLKPLGGVPSKEFAASEAPTPAPPPSPRRPSPLANAAAQSPQNSAETEEVYAPLPVPPEPKKSEPPPPPAAPELRYPLVENNIQILNGWDANEKEAGGSVSANSVQGGGFAGGTSIEFGISGKPAPIPAAKPVHELPVPAEKPHVTVTLKPAENAAGPQSTVNVYVPPPQAKDGEYYPGGAGGFPRGPLKAPRYTAPEKGYWVQLGSYIELARAQRAAAPILANGVSNLEIFAKEINGSMYYRIKMGPYLSRAEADGALIRLGRLSLPITEGFIVRD